jgi:thiamine-phosphate pyrophosphorylase
MSNILCVTNSSLCKEAFLSRIEKIAKAKPKGIILREKDLNEADYQSLAARVMDLCKRYQTPCILHSFASVALRLKGDAIHLPMHLLRQMSEDQKAQFAVIGASCHSVREAKEAEALGCTYLTAGHIFPTDCKKGLPGRGLDFLGKVCRSVSIPVYAIGGISQQTYPSVRQAGAKGACIMSGLMGCDDVPAYLAGFEG